MNPSNKRKRTSVSGRKKSSSARRSKRLNTRTGKDASSSNKNNENCVSVETSKDGTGDKTPPIPVIAALPSSSPMVQEQQQQQKAKEGEESEKEETTRIGGYNLMALTRLGLESLAREFKVTDFDEGMTKYGLVVHFIAKITAQSPSIHTVRSIADKAREINRKRISFSLNSVSVATGFVLSTSPNAQNGSSISISSEIMASAAFTTMQALSLHNRYFGFRVTRGNELTQERVLERWETEKKSVESTSYRPVRLVLSDFPRKFGRGVVKVKKVKGFVIVPEEPFVKLTLESDPFLTGCSSSSSSSDFRIGTLEYESQTVHEIPDLVLKVLLSDADDKSASFQNGGSRKEGKKEDPALFSPFLYMQYETMRFHGDGNPMRSDSDQISNDAECSIYYGGDHFYSFNAKHKDMVRLPAPPRNLRCFTVRTRKTCHRSVQTFYFGIARAWTCNNLYSLFASQAKEAKLVFCAKTLERNLCDMVWSKLHKDITWFSQQTRRIFERDAHISSARGRNKESTTVTHGGSTPDTPSTTKGVRSEVTKNEEEEDILAGDIFVNLIDTGGSLKRIELPGRGTNCEHLACFDIESFLKANEKSGIWKCTICRRPVTMEEVRMDLYMLKVLSDAPATARSFEISNIRNTMVSSGGDGNEGSDPYRISFKTENDTATINNNNATSSSQVCDKISKEAEFLSASSNNDEKYDSGIKDDDNSDDDVICL